MTTGVIFLFQGLMPLLTVHAPESQEAMRHFGYPPYFAMMLNVFKALGGITLIVPQIPNRIKEWAYAGFAIDFICACVSFIAVDGISVFLLFPLLALVLLILSYLSYNRLMAKRT